MGGITKALRGGTHQDMHGRKTLDYFWAHEALAEALGDVVSHPNAAFHPHCLSWMRQRDAWSAFWIRVPRRPRQFPLEQPVGCQPRPPAYGQVQEQQDLEAAWATWSNLAERELLQTFHIPVGAKK
eukprot:4453164-Prorocentrum_lima.AAC.1